MVNLCLDTSNKRWKNTTEITAFMQETGTKPQRICLIPDLEIIIFSVLGMGLKY